ncbi:class I SAM-dependent methyltransferase [Clostridium sp. YIM B02555]|uniref:class I SAM-dependent methyltransferase n=1 Tax=Clostridium sp. YIM B02555 TaxID=2911968 RepID=UPI001EEF407B|nr:class I SAM-dependent methyltransferase [Clostridium sp. YIM B02555]
MLNENIVNQVKKLSRKPPLFNRECGNIWTEEYLAKQMLNAHLDPNFDGASRRSLVIEKTVEFLNSKVLKSNSSILDLGCGPGLYAEKLCRKGHKITGVDFSQNTINYAKSSAKQQGLDIEYKYDDFFKLKYFKEYDVVMQVYGEFNTFSDEERDKLFKIVYNALKLNGLFIFDVSTPALRKKCGIKKNWHISEGGFWREKTHLVLEEGFQYDNDIWLDQYIIADNAGVQVYRNWFKDYSVETIIEIIKNSGFKIIDIRGSLIGEALKEDSEWIAIIAQKVML